ncbi:MAG TPA: hypothetical protein VHS59_04260, partial [Bacillota bacterium]|nr:hypothetical protein [Bacillota bacterium]
DEDLRGRQPGEAAGLIREGAIAAGFTADCIEIAKNESQGLAHAIKEAQTGDMVVVFYEKLSHILPVLEEALRRNISPVARQDFAQYSQNNT